MQMQRLRFIWNIANTNKFHSNDETLPLHKKQLHNKHKICKMFIDRSHTGFQLLSLSKPDSAERRIEFQFQSPLEISPLNYSRTRSLLLTILFKCYICWGDIAISTYYIANCTC